MIHTIYLMRHGLRLDMEDKAHYRYYLKRPMDIPLSAKGILQAQEAGERLAEESIDHIFASPFFRTLQTAHIVAGRLGASFNVEYGLMEFLLPKWFDTFPELLSMDEARLAFPSICVEYKPLVTPVYPEVDAIPLYFRVKRTLEFICKRYEGSILMVGHGASVYAAASFLLDEPSCEDMHMGEIRKYTMKDDKWSMEWAEKKHLTYSQDDYLTGQTKAMTQSLDALREGTRRESSD